jgi:quercetin dioxygenase-like cupin family protein
MTTIPDVLKVAESGYNLLMENKKVRVMEMQLYPGQKSPMHNHPNDHVVYVLKDAKFKLSFPDGNSDEFELKKGRALWIEAGPHETENIGTTDGHNVIIEVKF